MKIIYVTSSIYGIKEVFVDDEDYETYNKHRWYLRKHRNTFYAFRSEWKGYGKTPIRFNMHRCIMGVHINGDAKLELMGKIL